jgi:hypothetical protein
MATPMPVECECCPNQHSKEEPLKLFMTMWMCPSCIDKNKALTEVSEKQSDIRVQVERERSSDVIAVNNILKKAQAVVSSIEVKSDIFNAETESIVNIAAAIEADSNIENKAVALADILLTNYQTYKEKIFANQSENVELANKQNAIQKYLNDLKNKLTEVERERYKLLDVNYQPSKVKIANKPIQSPAKKKYDKADIVKAAQRANVPVSVIQMICVAKNMTPMQASDSLLAAGSKPELSS